MNKDAVANTTRTEQYLANEVVEYLKLFLPQLDRFDGAAMAKSSVFNDKLGAKLMFISQSGRRSGILASMCSYNEDLHHIYNPAYIAGQMMVSMLHHLYKEKGSTSSSKEQETRSES